MSQITRNIESDKEIANETLATQMSSLRLDIATKIITLSAIKEKDFAKLQSAFDENVNKLWENYAKNKQTIHRRHEEKLCNIDTCYDKDGNFISVGRTHESYSD